MKYILLILITTVLFLVISFGLCLKAIWTFDSKELKKFYKQYRLGIARHVWDGFKVNIY